VSEDPRDERFMWDAISRAKNKAYEHREYTIRLGDPNDLTILEPLRRGERVSFGEDEVALFQETVHDKAFELGVQRGAEEMLAGLLERLGVESIAEAELYLQKGRKGSS
jgi:hypothetical protein